VKDIEIPLPKERSARYRAFEILPGVLTWFILSAPFWLGFINVRVAAFLMLAYLLLWFVKAVGLNIRVLQAWRTLERHQKVAWLQLLDDVKAVKAGGRARHHTPKWHRANLERIVKAPNGIDPDKLVHAVIIATHNETKEVIVATIEAVLSSDYDPKQIIFLLAYEARGGDQVKAQALQIVKEYEGRFAFAEAVEHPDNLPNEVRGKGGNITFAGQRLKKLVNERGLDPSHVLVTTLDADNRPHAQYFACLSYVYSVCYDPKHLSFQPIPMFTNNIWDAPAPMRVIATGNSFWMMIQALRPHMLRNFAAHSQPLDALIQTNFWSTRTIVEDGHQFWRSYFSFEGKHEVIPIFLPVYQDAVLAKGYARTLKAQFVQLRRWAWGASDIAFVAENGFFRQNKIPKTDVWFKFLRLLEGHISWSTSPLILAFGALVPFILNNTDYLANQLPQIASRVQTFAMVGILVTSFLSFKILPPKPPRYRRHRTLFMVFQWALLPVTTICYSSFAAIYAQTRLLLNMPLGTWDATEKAVKTDTGTITSHK